MDEADLEPYLAQVKDKALKHALQYGMGFLHETMPAIEKEVVNRLFASGAIQVLGIPSCTETSSLLLLLSTICVLAASTPSRGRCQGGAAVPTGLRKLLWIGSPVVWELMQAS